MQSERDRSAAAARARMFVIAGCAIVLAGCTQDGKPNLASAQPRGATVAFESIDGPPPGQFRTLVRDLNDEAQSRRLAVISRESPSAYRVRGYLAAKVAKGETTIAWVWDVFDRDERRALRIAGEETAKGRGHRDPWSAADDGMMRRIAQRSMEQLSAFLTSPDVAPGTPSVDTTAPQVAALAVRDATSPEAAGIFRIFRANADPAPVDDAETHHAAVETGAPVPLPRRRPGAAAAVSAADTVTLAAARQH